MPRELTIEEQKIIDELYEKKANMEMTHAYVTTQEPVELSEWNGNHPVEKNLRRHTVKPKTTLKIVMVSRFGDCGLTDDLTTDYGYDVRMNFDDERIYNIRREP
jgi:hypothetical protein